MCNYTTKYEPNTSTYTINQCCYCDGYHTGLCPRIKEIEYYFNGTVKKVVLKESN